MDKVSLYLEKKTENPEPTANIDTSLFRFANGLLLGKDDTPVEEYHFLNDVTIGDTVRNQDGFISTSGYGPSCHFTGNVGISSIN